MDNHKNSLLIGGFLMLLGGLILADNLGYIYLHDKMLMSVIFLGLGGYLLFRHAQSKRMGTLIFSAIFLLIGLSILIESTRIVDNDLIGTLFLCGAGTMFAAGYVRNPEKWGLVIPAGVFMTLGLITLLNLSDLHFFHHDLEAGTFFLGLGFTFGYLYLIRNEQNKLEWAKVPAVILILFSGFLYMTTTNSILTNMILPVTFIALGGYLVLKSIQSRPINKAV